MKGQIWSYDLIVSVIVFMFTIGIIMFFWWSVATTTGERPMERLTIAAGDFADMLMSPGNPSNWESVVDTSNASTWTAVTVLGIGESFETPVISEAKAQALLEMNATNYTALKAKFRTNYNFYVEMKEFYSCANESMQESVFNCTARGITEELEEWNETEHYVNVGGSNFTLGLDPSNASAHSASVSNRFAIYNNSVVRLRVVLWTNQSWQ